MANSKDIIVFAVNTGIGNVIMTTPLIEELANKYDNSRITMVVSNQQSKNVLENNPYLDNTVVLPKSDWYIERFFPLSSIRKLLKLRKNGYDISITCIPHSHYANFCSFLIGARERIAHKVCSSDFLNTKTISPDIGHDVKNNLKLIDSKNKKIFPKIFLTDKEKDENDNKILIGIHPGSDSTALFRRWPLKNFIKVAKKLSEEYEVVFFIGPDEKDLREELLKIENKNIRIYESDNFREVIKEVNKCSFFISNDSGLSHVAEALRIPLIAIFGPSDYRRTGPITENSVCLTPSVYNPVSHTIEDIKDGGSLSPDDSESIKNTTKQITSEEVLKEFYKLKRKFENKRD